jgi:L-fuconolactonase
MIIDSHQHFWNLDKVKYPWLTSEYGPIYRTIEAPELEPQLREVGVDKTVIVQAMDSYEDTNYMLETASKYDWVGGIVGWVPLNNPDEAGKRLAEFTKNSVFKGVRHLIHEEKDPDWILQDSVIEGLRILASFGMTFDVVAVFPNHLKHVPTIAEKVPNLKMVLDHLAKPPIKDKQWEPWTTQLQEVAKYPQVYAKLSGLNTAADWETWSANDLKPYIDFAVETFGANRLMFGSDWPVALLAGDYAKVWTEANKAIADYTKEAKADILGGTAAEFYRIGLGE